jgi:hypothetical protein
MIPSRSFLIFRNTIHNRNTISDFYTRLVSIYFFVFNAVCELKRNLKICIENDRHLHVMCDTPTTTTILLR